MLCWRVFSLSCYEICSVTVLKRRSKYNYVQIIVDKGKFADFSNRSFTLMSRNVT